jgi:hypothetical protein
MIWSFLPRLTKAKTSETAQASAVSPVTTAQIGISMGFLSNLVSKEHTFVAWAEKELGILSVEAPTLAKEVDTIVAYVGGIAGVLAGIEGGPAAAAAVTSAVDAVHVGITALSGLVTDFGATPTAATMAASLVTNASALLAAAKVTNAGSVDAATKIINNLGALASKLAAALPAVKPATVSLS